VRFYRLNEIEDDTEMLMERYRVYRRMLVFNSINSLHVAKRYELFENQSYMAVVLEHISSQEEGRSLLEELPNIPKSDYSFIAKHILRGMDAIRETGISVKEVTLDKVFLKNGFYKIVDCPIFLSEKRSDTRQIEDNGVEIDDVWAFGIFNLKLLLGK
jgi:serine/threonine protein kinase